MSLVILGAGGMLGHALYRTFDEAGCRPVAVVHKSGVHYARFDLFDPERLVGDVDVRDAAGLEALLDRLGASVVLNAVGLTTRKLGGASAADVIDINASLPHRLCAWSERVSSRLIHFSTDCVFSGADGPYAPGAFRDADDLYGRSKALGEVAGTGVLTIRSSIVGLELEGHTELFEWVRRQRGGVIRGFRRVLYSGVTTPTMAEVVRSLVLGEIPLGGVEQLASDPITKYDLVRLAADAFGTGTTVEPDDEYVSNKVLRPSPFFSTHGLRPAPWTDQVARVAALLPDYDRWNPA